MAIIGADSGSYTPSDVERKRKFAAMLLQGQQKAREPFGALAQGLRGALAGWNEYEAGQAEGKGRSAVAEQLQSGDYKAALGNEWASPQQSAMASLLQGREWNQQDQQANWAREDARFAQQQALEREKLSRPDYGFENINGDILAFDKRNPGAGTQTVFDGEPAPPDQPAAVDEYSFAKSQGYPGTFEQWKMDVQKAGATSIDFNQNQGVAAGYADRMANSDRILADPAMVGALTSLDQPAKAAVPVAGNFLVSPEYQQAEQAQRDFINAILRRESGAVISPSEFENAKKQYFPQPGDNPDTIAQKANNRKVALEGVSRSAGPNYKAPELVPGAPAMGAVEDGYRYKGGDPADPNSWEPI